MEKEGREVRRGGGTILYGARLLTTEMRESSPQIQDWDIFKIHCLFMSGEPQLTGELVGGLAVSGTVWHHLDL